MKTTQTLTKETPAAVSRSSASYTQTTHVPEVIWGDIVAMRIKELGEPTLLLPAGTTDPKKADEAIWGNELRLIKDKMPAQGVIGGNGAATFVACETKAQVKRLYDKLAHDYCVRDVYQTFTENAVIGGVPKERKVTLGSVYLVRKGPGKETAQASSVAAANIFGVIHNPNY